MLSHERLVASFNQPVGSEFRWKVSDHGWSAGNLVGPAGSASRARLFADDTRLAATDGDLGAENVKNDQTKPTIVLRINNITSRTKPKQSQNKAKKSFRIDLPLENKAKTKPRSPLDLICPKKQSHAQRGGWWRVTTG